MKHLRNLSVLALTCVALLTPACASSIESFRQVSESRSLFGTSRTVTEHSSKSEGTHAYQLVSDSAADVTTAAALASAPELPVAIPVLPPTPASPWLPLIPFVVPLIVALLKGLMPNLPARWIPVLAALHGPLLALLDNLTGIFGHNPTAVFMLGAAGIGVRELVDQWKHKLTGAAPVAGLILAALVFGGCVSARNQVGHRSTTETLDPESGAVIRRDIVEDTTSTDGRTFADGKQSIAKLSAGQTPKGGQRVGITGESQESTSEVLQGIANIMQQFFKAGVEAGKAAAK